MKTLLYPQPWNSESIVRPLLGNSTDGGDFLIKLSDYVIRFLYNAGIRRIFMLTGGGCMHLVDSVGRQTGRNMSVPSRTGGAFAAQAHAEFTGTPRRSGDDCSAGNECQFWSCGRVA